MQQSLPVHSKSPPNRYSLTYKFTDYKRNKSQNQAYELRFVLQDNSMATIPTSFSLSHHASGSSKFASNIEFSAFQLLIHSVEFAVFKWYYYLGRCRQKSLIIGISHEHTKINPIEAMHRTLGMQQLTVS